MKKYKYIVSYESNGGTFTQTSYNKKDALADVAHFIGISRKVTLLRILNTDKY